MLANRDASAAPPTKVTMAGSHTASAILLLAATARSFQLSAFARRSAGGRSSPLATTSVVDECLTTAKDPVSCSVPDPAYTLQRYLQLRSVLSGEPLPDTAVQALIQQVEAESGSPAFNEEEIWGEWQLCWQLNTKEATSSQKALAPLPQFSNFMLDERNRKVFRALGRRSNLCRW